MKQRTKLILILLLVLVLAAAGLFFWRGGHHAICLSDVMEEWLDADHASHSVTIQLQAPGFASDGDSLTPQVRQQSLTAESFWTEYRDQRVYGLSVHGITAYLSGENLYLETGSAYSLPQLPKEELRELAMGFLLYGRITKTGDTYHISMESKKLDLSGSVTIDSGVRSLSLTAVQPEGQVLQITLIPGEPTPHPLPETVTDAMERAAVTPPMSITEPLAVLMPAMEELLPLDGQLRLAVSCGILDLSETVGFSMDRQQVHIDRQGLILDIDLPEGFSQLPPELLAWGLLSVGSYEPMAQGGTVTISLSGEQIQDICTNLVPQAENLGIAFEDSEAILTFTGGDLKTVSLSASGTVPFLFTEIPISFQTDLITH